MNCPARVISASFAASAGISTGGPFEQQLRAQRPEQQRGDGAAHPADGDGVRAHRGHRAQADPAGGEQVQLGGVRQAHGDDERPGERRAPRVVDSHGDRGREDDPEQGVEHHDQRVAVHPVHADERAAHDELAGS